MLLLLPLSPDHRYFQIAKPTLRCMQIHCFSFQHVLLTTKSKDFIPKHKSKLSIDTLFYSKIGEREQRIRREWILVKDNTFYCVYCICFSTWRKDALSTNGIDYNKGNCRLSEKLTRHEALNIHSQSKRCYLNLTCQDTIDIRNHLDDTSYMRGAVRCIFKIIIFISTHG